MSLLKAIKAQLGLSNTPANNFTITAEADNGTLKLARGNAGATTQDILTVDVNGNVLVDGNNLNLFSAKNFASNGYQKLPSGLIMQWGIASSQNFNTSQNITFPVAFPNGVMQAFVTPLGSASGTAVLPTLKIGNFSTTGMTTHADGTSGAVTPRWLAIGY